VRSKEEILTERESKTRGRMQRERQGMKSKMDTKKRGKGKETMGRKNTDSQATLLVPSW
jgi:hypothetical protein